jgi:RNA polymerase sigma factor (sigma-70 family)
MSDAADFAELFRRVRAGEADAAEALVREYEPEIRREVRLRLTDPKLRRVVDSMDICQSVLGNFFVRAALGQFDLESPQQLLALLTTMARHKVIDHQRRHQVRAAGERASRATTRKGGREPVDPGPSPSSVMAHGELLEEVRRRLTAEERQLADARSQGQSWEEIAARHGDSPEALRKRLARACDRIVEELRLDE